MLKTFPKGGIHPPENKLTSTKGIKKMPVPKMVYVPISQHIGIPAEIIVNVKDNVEIGQVIAKSGGFVSSNVHSPVAGVVTKLDKVIDTSGYKKQCIVIRTDAKNESNFEDISYSLKKDITMAPKDILQRINDYGIVGLGGATFPSHVKLSLKEGTVLDHLIINGVECEPYLTADHRLMIEKAEEILVGIKILMFALHVDKAIIGIENNKKDAIDIFKKLTKNENGIKVAALQVKYPQGGEKQLVRALLNREVPKNGLPLDVGVIVHNVGTIYAIYQAIQHNKPLTERVVTVTGKQLKNASNYWVKIGTPISDLINEVGGLPEGTRKIVNGGPMMGKAIKNLDVPVTKGTSGILVISEDEASRGEPKNCIRCGECIYVCPMGLEPHLLMNLSEKGMYEKASSEDIMTCIECGSCSYVCPSNRPLLDYIRFGKNIVKKLNSAKN
ncbi:MAG: electron transport complex subunit RsxC [Flavobacteriales bacterium]|nr:electron transport complex subunit RsxC [Flavobacteriia bacterium]NCP05868.1 electron transport complex subunit RsxC [Flavobacteriales bacterium]PIV93216.1 MAG: electron transport complex subunit RsxC [Flavobacteriaceae bacterium CG17_big_fil_post_rev_8_21_14_2_50_33_15]PIY12842.1 MAG: electron transport complex subunit RsxC [Flavobacteriaceae bacterium CG_4_10_14_3_um_filter_33_47]PJB19997.1 MAG: electron transport complex subunit RsxC [Flavobacteriaceae bacterium CG_4_9_14_3_um_filter_33_1